MGFQVDRVSTRLAETAAGVAPARHGAEGWSYGWSLEGHRRSGEAAVDTGAGPMTIPLELLPAWEAAVQDLLRDSVIRARWEPSEFWGLAASLTVAAHDRAVADRQDFLSANLRRLRDAGPALTIQLVANTTWAAPPIHLGSLVIGDAGNDLVNVARGVAAGSTFISEEQQVRWVADQVTPRATATSTPPVAILSWTVGQADKAISETERALRDVVDLPLLLEHDLASHKVYRRGQANRPGVRGLTIDRGALEALSTEPLRIEMAAMPLSVTSVFGGDQRVEWFSAEPLPLGQLYSQPYLEAAIRKCFAEGTIPRRIRTAARWYAEAHYTESADDSALALGVSIDAMLSGSEAMPGGAMADRFAVLHRDPGARIAARKRYLDAYRIRSSVAHGGYSSKLDDPSVLNDYFQLARDAAWRLLDLLDTFDPTSEKALNEIFDELRLGVRAWPTNPAQDLPASPGP